MKRLAATIAALMGIVLLAGLVGCAAKPSITTSSLPKGKVNTAYSQTLAASGGSGSYSDWMVKSVNLPDGLTLHPPKGVISGTPTTAGTYIITVVVTDSRGGTGSKNLSITITPAS